MIVFHVAIGRVETYDLRRGWSQWQGALPYAQHAVMFPATLAATRPYLNVPYVGNNAFQSLVDHSGHSTTIPIRSIVTGQPGAIGGGTTGIISVVGSAWFPVNIAAQGGTFVSGGLTVARKKTFEVWVKPTLQSASGYGALWVDNGNGASGIYLKNTGGATVKMAFYYVDPTTGASRESLSTTNLNVGTTYLLDVTVNGDTGTFYVNGVADGTFTWGALTIDQMFNNIAGETFKATLVDEMAIYPGCLTAVQCLANYNNGMAAVPATYRAAVLALLPEVYYELETADFTATPLVRQDGSLNTDFTVKYQAYVISKAWDLEPLARRKRLTESYLGALEGSATIQQTLLKDWDASRTTDTVSLVGDGGRVRPRFTATDMADAITVQTQLGDSRAIDQTWTLDFWQAVFDEQKGAK